MKTSTTIDPRFDYRTKKQFCRHIKKYTTREGRLIKAWRQRVIDKGLFSSLSIVDNGIDNSGEYVEKATRDADFRITTEGGRILRDGEHDVECKYTPVLWKATFKVDDLKAYIRNQAYVLVILGRGEESPAKWAIIGPGQMQRILDSIPHRTDNPGMGGKMSCLVPKSAFRTYLGKVHEW